jgi:anti-sigma factor RsiW
MHLEEGTLQAYLDGSLAAADRIGVDEHVSGCEQCAEQLEELRAAARLFSSSISLLNHPSRLAHAQQAAAQVLRNPPARVLTFGRPAVQARTLVRAATLVLGFAAAASATIPGSPTRDWLVTAWERIAATFGDAPEVAVPQPVAPTVTTPAVEPAPPTPVAGVSVRPGAGRVEIVLRGSASVIRVRLVDGERAVVQASGGAASASFQTGPGRVQVTGGTGGELLVDIPRSADRVLLVVNGQTYLTREDGEVSVPGPASENTGSEFLFRIQP